MVPPIMSNKPKYPILHQNENFDGKTIEADGKTIKTKCKFKPNSQHGTWTWLAPSLPQGHFPLTHVLHSGLPWLGSLLSLLLRSGDLRFSWHTWVLLLLLWGRRKETQVTWKAAVELGSVGSLPEFLISHHLIPVALLVCQNSGGSCQFAAWIWPLTLSVLCLWKENKTEYQPEFFLLPDKVPLCWTLC